MRSASTPSRALRAEAEGEPNQAMLGLAGIKQGVAIGARRRRPPNEAMPQASRITS